jgi:hypothetical protein
MKKLVVVIFGVLVASSLFPVVSSARENQGGITNRVCGDRR